MNETLQAAVNALAGQTVRLHLGCGGVRLDGYINVDLHPHDPSIPDDSRSGCAADVYADMRQLELADATVDQIFTVHTLEHFTRWEASDMLRQFRRILKPGGALVVETPDFWRCFAWLLHPRHHRRVQARRQFYGNQWDRLDYETHRYVWSAGELRRELLAAGFRRVNIHHRTQFHVPGRDMRAQARI